MLPLAGERCPWADHRPINMLPGELWATVSDSTGNSVDAARFGAPLVPPPPETAAPKGTFNHDAETPLNMTMRLA